MNVRGGHALGFVELDIKDLYVTDSENIPEEFYVIVLPKTVLYKRAAGFFSSSALTTMGKGLKIFTIMEETSSCWFLRFLVRKIMMR